MSKVLPSICIMNVFLNMIYKRGTGKLRAYIQENAKRLQILSLLIFFVLVLGIVTGSIFYMKTGGDAETINQKLSEAFLAIADPQNGMAAAKGFFAENLICCAVIFISAYFKAGAVFSAAVVVRKGFITGFTAAAAAKTYGIAGAALMAGTGVDLVLSSLVYIIFTAVSWTYSVSSEKKSKKFLIFFLIFSISIFCVLSFSRGFLTTTFMKLIYPKIT